MVVLREGMCPGLDEDLLRDLRSADIKTGLSSVSKSCFSKGSASKGCFFFFVSQWKTLFHLTSRNLLINAPFHIRYVKHTCKFCQSKNKKPNYNLMFYC